MCKIMEVLSKLELLIAKRKKNVFIGELPLATKPFFFGVLNNTCRDGFSRVIGYPQGARRKYHDDVSVMVISLEGRIWRSSG